MGKKVTANDLGLVLGARLLKMEELHFGYWEDGLAVTLANLPKAQARYTEYLLQKIPPGVKTVLDVGCGTGVLMKHLLERGYQVEGVCPSPMLAEMARKRLDGRGPIHETTMEGIDTGQTYDLLVFSESFQYIDPAISLRHGHAMLRPGGHLLLCDFFRTDAPGRSALSGGHRLSSFYRLLETQPFTVVLDDDITARTAPNLTVVDGLLTDYALPIRDSLAYYFRENHPRLGRLLGRLFRRRLEKLNFKYFSGARNAENFSLFKSYRCMLLKKEG